MFTIKGNIVDVVSESIFPGQIEIKNGKIYAVQKIRKAPSRFIIPGFIDAHVHIESSMLIPSEFARLAVCHGTIGTISDPHEIGNVLGKQGVKFMIENGLKTPFKYYFGAPSCVPATTFETAGAEIKLKDIEEIFNWPNVNYLAEMMNFPGVLNDDPDVLAKIELAKTLGKKIDGHAPGLRGTEAKKYIDAGITTDHECFTKEEALDKLKYGMKIIIREGSAAKNFKALWELIDEFPDHIMFCSDDKHPNDLVQGHINQLAARAVAKGCKLMNVLKASSFNAIKHYNMDVGLLQEGDPADFCIVEDLTSFKILETYIDGVQISKNGISNIKSVDEVLINNFNCDPIAPSTIKVKDQQTKVKVISVEDGQLITKRKDRALKPKNGYLESDINSDILKMVVVNRYNNAKPAISFVQNFGLKAGAIASSVAHDSHNIIAVGTSDDEISRAINEVIRCKGGVSLSNGELKMIVPLPLAGIMSIEDGYQVAESYEEIDKAAKNLGSKLSSPFMTLSFCGLLVIPELKLSDLGLFDGKKFAFTSIYSEL